MKMKMVLSSIVLLCLAGMASAAISADYPAMIGDYTDSSPDNTWPTDAASYPNLSDWYSTSNGSGAIWLDRAISSTTILLNDEVMEGFPNDPQLTMTVGGLDAGKIYDVYVVYWSKITTDHFGAMASLSGETLQMWDNVNATHIFAVSTEIGSSVDGCQGLLGQVTGVTQVSVDVSGYDPNGELTRAWFEGVTVVEVPEPVTMVLLSLGGLWTIRRRR